MTKNVRGTRRPMRYEVLKRVCLALVVLLVASAVMVGAGSAEGETYVAKIGETQYTSLEAAITDVAENTPTTLEIIAAGTYKLENTGYPNKILTFTGTVPGVIFDQTGLGNEFSSNSLEFNNVKIAFPAASHRGFTHTNKIVYNNCVFNGTQTLYAPHVEFNDCTFEGNDGKDIYYVWTYGIANAIFNDCTFNTNGKAILCYHDGGAVVANITLTNCKFSSDKTIANNKAAVEVGSDNHLQTYIITFDEKCTADGFAANNSPDPLWGNKNSMDNNHLIVVFVEMDKITLGDDKEYDGQAPTKDGEAVFTYITGEPSTLSPSYEWCEIKGGTGSTNVGEYQLKATATANGHPVSMVKEGTVTISPATLTLTIDKGQSKAVGTTSDPALTYSYTGNASGETPTVTGQLTRVSGEKAGTYLISFGTMGLANNGAFLKDNYKLELSTEPVYFTITPSVVIRGDNVPANYVLTEEQVSQDDMDTFNTTIEVSYSDKFSAGKYFINVSLLDDREQKAGGSIYFIIPYDALGISGDAGQYEFVVLHIRADGEVETITSEVVPEGLKIGPTTTSPFAIGYTVKQTPTPTPTGGSSSSQGSSVWLTETPTPTQTPTETEKPTDAVPTDIPVTQPTETPASPAFGALAALAGLGAVAVLRRK